MTDWGRAVDTPQEIRDWARARTAHLSPMSDEDCRAVGLIARDVDRKRAEMKAEGERGLRTVG